MQRRTIIEHLAPWLIWTAFFMALATFSTRSGGVESSNPRSLTQTATVAATPASDCKGQTLSAIK